MTDSRPPVRRVVVALPNGLTLLNLFFGIFAIVTAARGDYGRALPFLEYAANNGAPLRTADYYQLGYTQYQNRFYKQAIENLGHLNKQDSLLGQNGLYHLGDAHLQTGNKLAACAVMLAKK